MLLGYLAIATRSPLSQKTGFFPGTITRVQFCLAIITFKLVLYEKEINLR